MAFAGARAGLTKQQVRRQVDLLELLLITTAVAEERQRAGRARDELDGGKRSINTVIFSAFLINR